MSGVEVGENAHDSGGTFGLRRVDLGDPPRAHRAAHEDRVGHAGIGEVAGVRGFAGHLERTVDTVDAGPEQPGA